MPKLFSPLHCGLSLFALVSASIGSSPASDVILSPDDNTAWIQRNDEFLWGDGLSQDHWMAAPNTFKVVPGEKGLHITADPVEKGGLPSVARRMPYLEEYPWLQFDISDVFPTKGYRAFGLYLGTSELGAFRRGCVNRLEEGRYVTRVTKDPEKADVDIFMLRIDVAGFQFVLGNLSMKKDPLPRLEAHPVDANKEIPGIGDEMKVTVYLAEPAEDVSVELFKSRYGYPVTIGGVGALQLSPEDAEAKTWSGIFVLEPLDIPEIKKGELMTPGRLFFKATILGGNFPTPLLNWNEIPWDVNR